MGLIRFWPALRKVHNSKSVSTMKEIAGHGYQLNTEIIKILKKKI
jgi:hypothetical protein